MKLTEKQVKFVDYYIESGNATKAAIKAGYSKKTARQMGAENLTKPDIRRYLDERLKQIEDKRRANANEVMEYLTSVMRGEIVEQAVALVDGVPEIVDKNPAIRDRNKAAELLGKRYSLFTDRVEHTGDMEFEINIVGEEDAEVND